MGSNYNLKAVFSPRVERALRAWHKRAKQRLKLNALIEAESARYKRRCKPIVVEANYFWRKKQVSSRSPHQLEITLPPMAATMEDGSLARYYNMNLSSHNYISLKELISMSLRNEKY